MPSEPERNIRSLSPHGRKEASGHAAPGVHDIHQVGCPEPPPGILGPTPHGASVSSPYMPQQPQTAREKSRR
jgi:hypothetical protein